MNNILYFFEFKNKKFKLTKEKTIENTIKI